MAEIIDLQHQISTAFTEVKKETGELIPLVPNNNNTVQPVALMRLGLFVPTLKSTSKGRKGLMVTTNATEELKQLSLVTSEGFDNIQITGARLDMDNDFKTWVGIIHAFAKYKITGDKVSLPFVEFVKLCGIPSVVLPPPYGNGSMLPYSVFQQILCRLLPKKRPTIHILCNLPILI